MSDAEKRAFEAWFARAYHPAQLEPMESGCYLNGHAGVAWDAWQAARQAQPAAHERFERLKFELRQAMLDYGAAERANDPERIRETSTRGVALIESLAPISTPAAQQAEPVALPPLPDAFDYGYRSDGPGIRKFALYNEDQMHAYARAVLAQQERQP